MFVLKRADVSKRGIDGNKKHALSAGGSREENMVYLT